MKDEFLAKEERKDIGSEQKWFLWYCPKHIYI